jgi:hypothetical protein
MEPLPPIFCHVCLVSERSVHESKVHAQRKLGTLLVVLCDERICVPAGYEGFPEVVVDATLGILMKRWDIVTLCVQTRRTYSLMMKS